MLIGYTSVSKADGSQSLGQLREQGEKVLAPLDRSAHGEVKRER